MKNLGLKTVFGFVQLAAIMSLALFLPAWTLNFWQAWVFIGLFVLCSALITVYLWEKDPALLERRVKGGPAAEKQRSQQWIQGLASLAFLGILIVPSIDHRFHWSYVATPIVVAGDCAVALGFLIIFLVFRQNSFTSATIEVAPEQQVISTGPYATIRHPMYAGALLLLIGTPIALGSWIGMIMFLPMLIVIIARLRNEEKFLLKDLPGYREYCSKVRYRLIPKIW